MKAMEHRWGPSVGPLPGHGRYELLEERRFERLVVVDELGRLVERVNRGDVFTGLMGRGDA